MSLSSFTSDSAKPTSLFSTAQADLARVHSTVTTVETFMEKVMGEAETAAAVLALVDPAVGVPLLAEITAVQTAYGTFKTVAADPVSSAPRVLDLGTTLIGDLADLSTRLGPFFKDVANDATTAEAAFKALFTGTAGTLTAAKAV